jgi:2-polyprenyl-6-hydroxyphenyl methylase/3-demethylubiquinone-9 3-methyltransferase
VTTLRKGADGGYSYTNTEPQHTHSYLWPAVFQVIEAATANKRNTRVFDLGCGNGAFAAALASRGFEVAGVDPSEEGIRCANDAFPNLNLHIGSSYDDLQAQYGQFDVVVSLEVVEHVYTPRTFASCLFDLVEEGGLAIVSTPYHGYIKNLTLALTGKLDAHFTALWDHGHIKFWSVKTLRTLLDEVGFHQVSFLRVGRVPPLAKSMIAVARK